MFLAAVAYSGGLIVGCYAWRPGLWWLVAVSVFVLAALFWSRRRPYTALAGTIFALFFAGTLTTELRPSHGNLDTRLLVLADGNDVTITGHVIKEGNSRLESADHFEEHFNLAVDEVAGSEQHLTVHSNVRVSVYGREAGPAFAGESEDEVTRHFEYGERLRINTRLLPPRNFRNPGAFDYRGFLADEGIVALASAKPENIEVLPGFEGNRLELLRSRIYGKLVRRIRVLWPTAQGAVIDALLIGENEFVGRELLGDFQRTGTYHVLVISGLKVGILAMFIFWLLRRVRVASATASVVAIALTTSYALLTNVGVPVWRATLMLALYLIAKQLYRDRSVLNTIGTAAIALLVFDPSAIFGASYQLSFLCVLIIGAIGSPIMDRTTRPVIAALKNLNATGYDFALPPRLVQFRLDLRMIAGRLGRFVGKRLPIALFSRGGRVLLFASEFLLISFILQAGFALPMAYYFHRATLISLPANVLAVPLTEIAMIAAMLAIGVSYLSISAAKIPAVIAGLAAQGMVGSVRWLGALRVSDMRVPTPGAAAIILCSAGLVLAMVFARRRAVLAVAGLLAMFAGAFWICFVPRRPDFQRGLMEVTAIDVGQGDSILVVSPQGKTLLIDAGGIPHWMHSELDIGEDVVSPYLWSRGFHQLDTVAVSHAHADHIGGMSAILGNFHPRELWIGLDTSSAELNKLLNVASALGIPVIHRKAGDAFEADNLDFHVLAPARDTLTRAWRPNDDCLVMTVRYGSTSAMLEADAEKETEWRLLSEAIHADLLKVGHHGSATSTMPEFLSAVHPLFAIISVGARNVYGHPRHEVLQRLASSSVRTYRTDLDGATTFYLDGRTVIAPEALR